MINSGLSLPNEASETKNDHKVPLTAADRERFVINCFMKIDDAIKKGGKLKINKHIQNKVRHLYFCYGLKREEIAQYIKLTLDRERHYEKYDPDKSKLSTFIVHYTNYSLNGLIRRIDDNFKEIPKGNDEVFNSVTPEDLVIAKELLDLAVEFFDKNELEVLLGVKDRHTEAERIGVEYFTYCKRLQRKSEAFRSYLKQIDYF